MFQKPMVYALEGFRQKTLKPMIFLVKQNQPWLLHIICSKNKERKFMIFSFSFFFRLWIIWKGNFVSWNLTEHSPVYADRMQNFIVIIINKSSRFYCLKKIFWFWKSVLKNTSESKTNYKWTLILISYSSHAYNLSYVNALILLHGIMRKRNNGIEWKSTRQCVITRSFCDYKNHNFIYWVSEPRSYNVRIKILL